MGLEKPQTLALRELIRLRQVAASQAGQVSMRRLIGGLALAPMELFAIIRLAQRYRAARRSLSAVASAGVA